MSEYTKADLRVIHDILTRALPPGGRPLSEAAEIVRVNAVIAKTAGMITSAISEVERGKRLLVWRIATDFAPTMNELSSWLMRTKWRPAKAKQELQRQIAELIAATPGLDLCGAQLRRWVRVTRFTVQVKNVDDTAIDQIGGKLPLDVLTKAGLLVNDSPRWVVREACVKRTKMGNTHLLVELFSTSDEREYDAEPEDGPAPVVVRKKSIARTLAEECERDFEIGDTPRGPIASAAGRKRKRGSLESHHSKETRQDGEVPRGLIAGSANPRLPFGNT